MTPNPGDITVLLTEMRNGSQQARDTLISFVYDELRRLAAAYIRRERSDHTLQPTALVHEAVVKLLRSEESNWQNRAHFLGVAATVMRRILIDHARARNAGKRRLGQKVELSAQMEESLQRQSADLVDLDRALDRLAEVDPRLHRVVELRYFGGLSVEETAEVMAISPRTAKRDWSIAKAWLKAELGGAGHEPERLTEN